MKYVELCERLDRTADSLTERVLGEMYQNPFWLERFGERAHIHGRKDGRSHIDYLIQALGSDDATVIENYARWLQQVLTTRGMCTRHLADNFDLLGVAIASEGWREGDAAVRMLAAATAALSYSAGPARDVQDQIEALAKTATETMQARHPEWMGRVPAGRTRSADDLVYPLHYAADGLALGSPAMLLAYLAWLTEFLERHQVPRTMTIESLETLREVPDAPPALRDILSEALATLSA